MKYAKAAGKAAQQVTGKLFVSEGMNRSLAVRLRRARGSKESYAAQIHRHYQDLHDLILGGGKEEAIAQKRQELRRLQGLEAARMAAHAERRTHLSAGKGYLRLKKAERLLAK